MTIPLTFRAHARGSAVATGWAVLVGGLSGTASALFLWLLDAATAAHWAAPWLLWTLPVVGWLVSFSYAQWGAGTERGTDWLLGEIVEAREPVPIRMAPLVLLGTLLTHLAGGSAGREGTAVQMGGSLAEACSRWLGVAPAVRRWLLRAGLAGGFGAVFGTPWAGAVFALEVVAGHGGWQAMGPVLAASFVGHETCLAWGTVHTDYAGLAGELGEFSGGWWLRLVIAGVVFGGVAQGYVRLTQWIKTTATRLCPAPTWRAAAGGALIIGLVYLCGTREFLGLGVRSGPAGGASILACFAPAGVGAWAWAGKLLFTAITLGTGFKGGEVTPLFFVGAALGQALGVWLGIAPPLLAALGMVAVFGAAAKTPWACTVMAGELFGWALVGPAVVACHLARWASGARGIYSTAPHGN